MTPVVPFEIAPWNNPFNYEGWLLFRVGTCHGQWRSTPEAYEMLAIMNDEPGNGHFNITLEWFYISCKRDGKYLRIRELMNKQFADHLRYKRGFVNDGNDMIKKF